VKVSLSDEAIEDARAAADWYIDQGASRAADAFFDDIEQSIQLLLRHPRVGTPGVARTRSLPLQTFPHSLVYRVEGEGKAGGKASTKAKAAASRRNGKLGGRPRKLKELA